MIKKLTILFGSILISIFTSTTFALTAWTLWDKSQIWPNKDVEQWQEVRWSRSVFDIISLVNKYLWFTIWLVCFAFMIWNGYQLIMARGDQKQMDSAVKALIWCGIWLTVCILAHIIVNIAVKIFAT